MRPDIALAGWASVHTWERWLRRDFCVTERSCAALILKVDRHIWIGFCATFWCGMNRVVIIWYQIAFHADVISDPVLCLLSPKVASKEERTNHLCKILITLFSTTRERRPCRWTKQWKKFQRIYMKKGFSLFKNGLVFFCSCSTAWPPWRLWCIPPL